MSSGEKVLDVLVNALTNAVAERLKEGQEDFAGTKETLSTLLASAPWFRDMVKELLVVEIADMETAVAQAVRHEAEVQIRRELDASVDSTVESAKEDILKEVAEEVEKVISRGTFSFSA